MWKRAETALQARTVRETSKDTDKKPKGPKKPRSPAQMEATRKMIEASKARRFKSGEEARKSGHKGGKASGESKRAKKNMQELAKYMLDLPLHEGDVDEDGTSFDNLSGKNTTVRAGSSRTSSPRPATETCTPLACWRTWPERHPYPNCTSRSRTRPR